MASPTVNLPGPSRSVPDSFAQVMKLTRYQIREFLRSRRFFALAGIVLFISAIVSFVVYHFRGTVVSTNVAFYGTFWAGGVGLFIVLSAVFFGGDAIAGEFQNKTGYFLMGLPLRRTVIYVGKFIAAFAASVAMILLYLVILIGNGVYYFGAGAFPWQLGVSLLLALVYLSAVLGATFLFSSLFKTSAYGFVLTAILFLFGFTLLEDLIVGLVMIEPWMIISYAESTIGTVFNSNINWGLTAQTTQAMIGRAAVGPTTYTAGIAEGVVIMLAYLLVTALGGLFLFEREEFS